MTAGNLFMMEGKKYYRAWTTDSEILLDIFFKRVGRLPHGDFFFNFLLVFLIFFKINPRVKSTPNKYKKSFFII